MSHSQAHGNLNIKSRIVFLLLFLLNLHWKLNDANILCYEDMLKFFVKLQYVMTAWKSGAMAKLKTSYNIIMHKYLDLKLGKE